MYILNYKLVALDISMAFGKVWHRGLIHKLKSYGISGELLNFLSERQISVVQEGHSSSIRLLMQVSRRAVSLSLLFINDLPDSVSSQFKSIVYTAYPGPLSATSCAQASIVLNHDLENVINWGNNWLVSFNQKKTHLLSLSRSRSSS